MNSYPESTKAKASSKENSELIAAIFLFAALVLALASPVPVQ
jgi:hypothetical protein